MNVFARKTKLAVRAIFALTATAALVVGPSLVGPDQSASAATSCLYAHCYDIARRRIGGDDWIGAKARIPREYLAIGPDAGHQNLRHINSQMWFSLNSSATAVSYIEFGIANGRHRGEGLHSDSDTDAIAYDLFWADTDTNGYQNLHIIQHAVPNANISDIYQVTRKPYATDDWLISLNGNQINQSTVTTGWTSHRVEMGGEWFDNTCAGGVASTFNMQAWYMNTSYNWGNYAWGDSQGATTQLSPDCGFNAQMPSVAGSWSWNKQ